MFDNIDNKICKLESRMDDMETVLREIKDALVKKGDSSRETIDKSAREAELDDVEVRKIDNIMANFDFNKVHDIMERLDWKWAMTKWGVPTVDELKNEAHRILVDACKEKTYISTGGFRAVYETTMTPMGDDDPYVGLEFIVEECEGLVDDDE